MAVIVTVTATPPILDLPCRVQKVLPFVFFLFVYGFTFRWIEARDLTVSDAISEWDQSESFELLLLLDSQGI